MSTGGSQFNPERDGSKESLLQGANCIVNCNDSISCLFRGSEINPQSGIESNLFRGGRNYIIFDNPELTQTQAERCLELQTMEGYSAVGAITEVLGVGSQLDQNAQKLLDAGYATADVDNKRNLQMIALAVDSASSRNGVKTIFVPTGRIEQEFKINVDGIAQSDRKFLDSLKGNNPSFKEASELFKMIMANFLSHYFQRPQQIERALGLIESDLAYQRDENDDNRVPTVSLASFSGVNMQGISEVLESRIGQHQVEIEHAGLLDTVLNSIIENGGDALNTSFANAGANLHRRIEALDKVDKLVRRQELLRYYMYKLVLMKNAASLSRRRGLEKHQVVGTQVASATSSEADLVFSQSRRVFDQFMQAIEEQSFEDITDNIFHLGKYKRSKDSIPQTIARIIGDNCWESIPGFDEDPEP